MKVGWLPEPERHPLWPGIYKLLKRSADRTACSVFDAGDLLWIALDEGQIIGAATARALDPDTAELMHTAGTRIHEWAAPMESQICDWARMNGARKIVSTGRKGWRPIVEPLGWHVTAVGDLIRYEKEL